VSQINYPEVPHANSPSEAREAIVRGTRDLLSQAGFSAKDIIMIVGISGAGFDAGYECSKVERVIKGNAGFPQHSLSVLVRELYIRGLWAPAIATIICRLTGWDMKAATKYLTEDPMGYREP